MASPVKFLTQVTSVIRHSERVATYEFRYLDRRPRYKPGQFLHLALDAYDPSSHWPESRVFTIAKGAKDRELIRLSIAEKGKFTQRILKELEVGRHVWMKAPYGEFIVRCEPGKEVVLIAGGTGVSPFVAFMEDALVQGIDGNVWLHYAAREPDLLVFRDLADRCAEKFAEFNVEYYVENVACEKALPGRIDLENACRALRDIGKTTFYLCGPPEMIQVFSTQLSDDFGVPQDSIRVDDWD